MLTDDTLLNLANLAITAGREIMVHYENGTEIRSKADESPVTAADDAAEAIILPGLAHYCPDIPVVSEEAASRGDIPQTNETFFLVDPLDGTKEFINKNGWFTVNIGLVIARRATLGVVYAPAKDRLYLTLSPTKAAMATITPDRTVTPDMLTPIQASTRTDNMRALGSFSHKSSDTDIWLDARGITDRRAIGSSVKFCMLAEGEAEVYPRLAPTMEWDTAAGEAVLRAAGGHMTTLEGGPFLYGKNDQNYRNPGFIATGNLVLPAI